MLDDSPYWTRERREIVAWLNDHAPSFSDGDAGAVRLLHTPTFSARVHLVCHLVRDIYRYLPEAIDARAKASPRPAEVFPNMVKELATQWKAFPPSMAEQFEDTNSDRWCEQTSFQMHFYLVEKSNTMAKNQPTVGKVLAGALFRSGVRSANEFIAPWIIRAFDAEYKFFVEKAHLAKEVPDDSGLIEHFEAFERAFHSSVGSYFTGKEELDAILQKTNIAPHKAPTSQRVGVTLHRIRAFEFAMYFFSRLENPLWISSLSDSGIFSSPPPTENVEGGVRFPPWPASQYLARMAAHAPREVADILMRAKTENPAVVRDILVAANTPGMPTEIAAELVPTICEAIKAEAIWVFYSDATEFCVRLAVGGKEDAAMTLAEALYGLQYPTSGDREHHRYKEGLKKVLPVLTKARAEAFLVRLCYWLCTAIKKRDHFDPATDSDYSWSWRPAIEEHEQNRTYDFACEMVGFVRQAFEQAIGEGSLTLAAGLAIVDGVGKESGFSVFERLRVHLINCFAEQAPDLARSVMMDRDNFDKSDLKHEYAMLMGRRFPMLSSEDRNIWLGWINAGPDMSGFDVWGKLTRRTATQRRRSAKSDSLLAIQPTPVDTRAFMRGAVGVLPQNAC